MNTGERLLIHDAVVYRCLPDETPINHGAVLVEDGDIEDVGPEDQLLEKYPDAPTRSLDQKLLMPGLVNTHTHLNMTIFRGLAEDLPLDDWLEETYRFRRTYMDEETQKLGVKLSLAESIRCGVTTVADMSFYQHRYESLVDDFGIRAILYDTIMEEYLGTDRQPEIEEYVRGNGPDRITRGAALHAPYSTNEELLEWFTDTVVAETDVPYAIHLAETLDETREFLKTHDRTATQWLDEHNFLTDRLLAVHGVWLNEDELQRLAERDVSLSHNPESNMKLGAGIAPVTEMIEEGIPVGIGTDSAASNNDLDLFSDMDAAGKLQKVHHRDPTVLPSERIVEMATRGGAEALGMEGTIGTIEEGKRADLITVDWNQLHLRPVYNTNSQLVYSVSGQDVRDVWVGGEPLLRNGELTKIDEDELFREVNEANHRINRQRKQEKS
jgi:5-methylthioadenosine/S-adenosylhomocysteine deaminase